MQHDSRIDSVEKLKIHPMDIRLKKRKIEPEVPFDFEDTDGKSATSLTIPSFNIPEHTMFCFATCNGITQHHAGSGRRLDMTTDAPSGFV